MKQPIDGIVDLLGFCTTPALAGCGAVKDSFFLNLCFVDGVLLLSILTDNFGEIKKTPMLHCTGVFCRKLYLTFLPPL